MKKLQMTHLIMPSPWPLMGSMAMFSLTFSMVMLMHKKMFYLAISALIISLLTFYSWTKDIFSESTMEGQHSKKTASTLKIGMILFIVSEIFLFVSVFWTFFHSSMSPSVEIGMMWPPYMISSFNYEEIPMMNTIILVSSGATLTAAHHFMMKNIMNSTMVMMMTTVSLGVMFTLTQLIEYMEAKFSMNDSVYGASFFMATGLHGAHVIVGSIFLTVVMFQIKNFKSMSFHFLSFEMAAWYWHFVDVVWLFLLITIYWWGA